MANENRLISANKLAERVMSTPMYINGVRNGKTLVKEFLEKYRNGVMRMICEAPTVDAVEVVHGQWKRTPTSQTLYCGVCDKIPECQIETNFCPNCGAKMDGGNKDA